MAYHMNEEVQRLNRRGVHPRDLWGVISFSGPNPSLDPNPAGPAQAPRSPPSGGRGGKVQEGGKGKGKGRGAKPYQSWSATFQQHRVQPEEAMEEEPAEVEEEDEEEAEEEEAPDPQAIPQEEEEDWGGPWQGN